MNNENKQVNMRKFDFKKLINIVYIIMKYKIKILWFFYLYETTNEKYSNSANNQIPSQNGGFWIVRLIQRLKSKKRKRRIIEKTWEN